MRRVFFVMSLAFYSITWIVALSSCGGDGGDVPVDAAVPALPVGASIQCEHDGDVYICNDDTCYPDAEHEIVGAVEEEEPKFLIRPKADINGPVTIIAECGSNVIFSVREDNSAFNATADVGVSSAQ